jgi:hypothetical protein
VVEVVLEFHERAVGPELLLQQLAGKKLRAPLLQSDEKLKGFFLEGGSSPPLAQELACRPASKGRRARS